MITLRSLDQTHLHHENWPDLIGPFDKVEEARTDPRFFKQVSRFERFLREIASIAVELNSNRAASKTAYEHVKSSKILAKNKKINQFEDIQSQTYEICLDALTRDLENMYSAFCERNLEALEDQYRQVVRWPVRYAATA